MKQVQAIPCSRDHPQVSLIIPVGPEESQLESFLEALPILPDHWELIISATSKQPETIKTNLRSHLNQWIVGPAGRGGQLNRGACCANGKFLWFLHCDSQITDRHFILLQDKLNQELCDVLIYFDLKFDGGHFLTSLNAWGANIRSRFLSMPFGDQGFCLAKSLWKELGGFSETTPYGEDHLLVWACRRMGVRLLRIPLPILTSSRKYQNQGWFKTTIKHIYFTWRQALPELMKLIKIKIKY